MSIANDVVSVLQPKKGGHIGYGRFAIDTIIERRHPIGIAVVQSMVKGIESDRWKESWFQAFMSSCFATDRCLGGQFYSAPFANLDGNVFSETTTMENPVESAAIDIMEASTNADENDDVVELECCSSDNSSSISSVCTSSSHVIALAPTGPVYYVPVTIIYVPCWYTSVTLTS